MSHERQHSVLRTGNLEGHTPSGVFECTLRLANIIWRARFGVHISERELSLSDDDRVETEPKIFTLLVVCINNNGSQLKPVSAARFAYLERGDIKTAKKYSVSSSYWTVYKKFASQSLHNRTFFKKQIRRCK